MSCARLACANPWFSVDYDSVRCSSGSPGLSEQFLNPLPGRKTR